MSFLNCLRCLWHRSTPPAEGIPGGQPLSAGSERVFSRKAQDDTGGQLAHASPVLGHPNHTPSPDPSGSHLPVHPHQSTISVSSEDRTPIPVPHQIHAPEATSQDQLFSPQQPPPEDRNLGMFYNVHNVHESRNLYVEGTSNTVNYTNAIVSGSNNFMKELLEKTIPGAAFNSAARSPPPRCHPGTRLAVLQRCKDFIATCSGQRKIRWVVGGAGVGKSAIMQSVAESPLSLVIFQASIFFFVNGRSDASRAIVTLAYQLAAKNSQYRQFIEHEINDDPSLLDSSMSVQFNKFIVEPLIDHSQISSPSRILVIIDGLDECDQSQAQRELLQLITDCCLTYPSSPIVWMIASRPEPHIVSFFAQDSVEPAYEKEEILVDSNEARADVEKFLHDELKKIQDEYSLNPQEQWPPEQDFWKLAEASGGLFAYAYIVTRYIGDRETGDPNLQLHDVLEAIDAHPMPDISREDHPMALLDALYSRILSKVPTKVEQNMRKFLLALAGVTYHDTTQEAQNFIALCNWLGITCDEAYAALRHLNSVLYVPGREKACEEQLRAFHKSFIDYISDFSRSGFSRDVDEEARRLYVQCTLRVIEQTPDGLDVGDLDYSFFYLGGELLRGPGSGNISITWSEVDWSDREARLRIYKMAFVTVQEGVSHEEPAFYNVFYARLLATRFRDYSPFSIRVLRDFVSDQSHRREFLEQGVLKQIPIGMLITQDIGLDYYLQFYRPTTNEMNIADPWDPSCTHERYGEWGPGIDQSWTTRFCAINVCHFCRGRLGQHLDRLKTLVPDHLVTVLSTSTQLSLVELQFVDPDDGVSEWMCWFSYKLSVDQRRALGSTI